MVDEETVAVGKIEEQAETTEPDAGKASVQLGEEPRSAIDDVKEVVIKHQDKQQYRKDTGAGQWVPKTALGHDVVAGKYTSINEILSKGELILEPEIIDYLIPDLQQEIIYIGGSPGKGGGIKRTATKITTRMHKSGRRFTLSSFVVVGNADGVVGMGQEASREHRQAIEKSTGQAKLNVTLVKRGCGSWECGCNTNHSIPFKSEGKHGSVTVVLNPAPKGVGIVADDESKKILKLAGIKDVWVRTFGQTSTRANLALAVFAALKNLSRTKGDI